jgi:hypothetical protein
MWGAVVIGSPAPKNSVECRRAGEVECADCEVTGPDLRAFLLDLLARRGVGVTDVVVSVS